MPYVLNGPRWDGNSYGTPATVTWSFADLDIDRDFSESGYPDFDATISGSLRGLVRTAFSAWDQASGIDFIEVPDSLSSEIRVGQNFIDGSGSTVGLTTTWYSSQVIYRSAIELDNDAFQTSSLFYLVTLHEIGHALGLGHSSSSADVMYPTVGNLTSLSDGDIAGARALYGVDVQVSTITGLDALIESSALNYPSRQSNNEAQFQALTGAYVYLGFGVPTISGYDNLITNNNSTNFGATLDGAVFNTENVFINAFAALYRFNVDARGRFDAIVGGGTLANQLTSVYDSIIPHAEQSPAGRAYFLSQSNFYSARAGELEILGNGAAVVGAAALANIAVRSDIPGLGDAINDLRAAINSGSAMIPAEGDFTPTEVADGTAFDGDDTTASTQRLATSEAINFESVQSMPDPAIEYHHLNPAIPIVGIAEGYFWAWS